MQSVDMVLYKTDFSIHPPHGLKQSVAVTESAVFRGKNRLVFWYQAAIEVDVMYGHLTFCSNKTFCKLDFIPQCSYGCCIPAIFPNITGNRRATVLRNSSSLSYWDEQNLNCGHGGPAGAVRESNFARIARIRGIRSPC